VSDWTAAEWIGVTAVIAALAGVAATLYTRRPTRAAARAEAAAARSEARKVDCGFELVGDVARNSPGFHDGLKLRVCNESTQRVLAVVVWANRDSEPEPWWQASDGLGAGDSAELRLPDAWPCDVDVYYFDHLERCWRRRVNGHGVGDVERVARRKWPSVEPPRRRWLLRTH
jgi:hypothetical protein